jgi:hypothetical protein
MAKAEKRRMSGSPGQKIINFASAPFLRKEDTQRGTLVHFYDNARNGRNAMGD